MIKTNLLQMIGVILFWTLACVAAEGVTPLPDAEGFAGMYAGSQGESLIAAGGANFPRLKPWEGGIKHWSDLVYRWDTKKRAWQTIGKLPQPRGYGISISHPSGLILVGGDDGEKPLASVLRLKWNSSPAEFDKLPELPQPLAYHCGALWGHRIMVFGGQTSTNGPALREGYFLDLSRADPRWESLPPFPGEPRILATAGIADDAFWVIGGAALHADKRGQSRREYLRSVYRYRLGEGWREMPSLPRALAASPAPASADSRGLLLYGGDDGSQVGKDPTMHRGFRTEILHYDLHSARWSEVGTIKSPRVTCPTVAWQGGTLLISGEVSPGRRTPDILEISRETP